MLKPLGRNGQSAQADGANFEQRAQHVKPYPLVVLILSKYALKTAVTSENHLNH